jgi:chemotaxis protein CheX
MDKEIINTTLKESSLEVFEKMLFVELIPVEKAELNTDSSLFDTMGSISFSGLINGKLQFACKESLARELTISFLGMEPEEMTTEHVQDNVKEIVNMICGNMFCKLDENKSLVQLGIPSFEKKELVQNGTDCNALVPFIELFFVCSSLFDAEGCEEKFVLSIYKD